MCTRIILTKNTHRENEKERKKRCTMIRKNKFSKKRRTNLKRKERRNETRINIMINNI